MIEIYLFQVVFNRMNYVRLYVWLAGVRSNRLTSNLTCANIFFNHSISSKCVGYGLEEATEALNT